MEDAENVALAGIEGIELVDRPWFPYLCTEVEHWQWKTAGDEHFNLWMALTGDGYLSCDGATYRIQPGSFFVFSPRQHITAAHYSGPRITRFSAHFFPQQGGRRQESVRGLPLLGGEVQDLALLRRQIDMIMRVALRRGDDRELAAQLQALLLRLCGGEKAKVGGGLSPCVGEALRIFREDPVSVGSIGSLAARLGTSRSNFDRTFAREVGQAPQKFLINCKMIEARRYLESSHLRIGEIADALGYRDIYFFSRQFKQVVGRSPGRYRRELKLGGIAG